MKDGLSSSTLFQCMVCGLRVKANSVLCVHCEKVIHSGCIGVKRVMPIFSRIFAFA